MQEYKFDEFKIYQYRWKEVDANSFLVVSNRKALLFDVIEDDELFDTLTNLDEITVILTHSHFDHIYGLNQLRRLNTNIVVYATKQCSNNIGNKYRNMSASANAFMAFYKGKSSGREIEPICCEPADKVFEGETTIEWCGHFIELFAVYGHSNDGLLAVIDGKYLFSGDTLLSCPTVTRFPGGDTVKFWEEDMPKIKKMGNKVVFPGHGLPSDLDRMLNINVRPEKI